MSIQVQEPIKQAEQEFAYRLDFYWQAIAVYAVALLVYALLKGSISAGALTLALYDPIVLLLGAVVLLSALTSVINWYMRRSVVVGETFIRFRNRFRTRTFYSNEIISIATGRKKLTRLGGAYRMVRIRLVHRRRILRVRPSLYEREHELMQALLVLKRRLMEAKK